MLTKAGIGLLVAGVLLYLAGVKLGWRELLVLGVACLVAVLVAVLWVVRPSSLDVTRTVTPERVTKGQPVIARLQAHNGSRRVHTLRGDDRFGASAVPVEVADIPPGQTKFTSYALPTTRRGVIPVGPIRVITSDPLQLARRVRRRADEVVLFVYPLIRTVPPLPSDMSRHLDGPTADRAPQGTLTFHRLREYVRGDDLRMIHWRSTARTGDLMVRHNVDTSQPHIVVVLDNRPSSYQGDYFEEAVDAAASIVFACTERRFPVRLHTTSGRMIGNQRRPQPYLDLLAEIGLEQSGSLVDSVARIPIERGSMSLVVVGGALEAAELRGIAQQRRRFEVLLLASFGPGPDDLLTPPGLVRFWATDSAEFARKWKILR